MTQRSILDLDEALQRLQQMEQDQVVLVELIGKLKGLMRIAEGRAEDLGERLTAADGKLAETSATAESLRVKTQEYQDQAAGALAEVDRARQGFEEGMLRTVSEVRDRFAQFEKEVRQRQTEWSKVQQAALHARVAEIRTEQAAFHATVRAQQAQVADQVQELKQQDQRLGTELHRRSIRTRRALFALCVGVILTAVLGGYTAFRTFFEARPPTAATSKQTGPARLWTDRTGKYSIEATLESYDGEAVRLRKTDGTTVDVPFDKLTEPDQESAKKALRTLPKR